MDLFRVSTTYMGSRLTANTSGSLPATGWTLSIRRAERWCARSTLPATRERPATAGTCIRSPRTASRRSISRLAVCSPRSRRPAAAETRGWPGPKGRSGWALSGAEDPSDRSADRGDSSQHRVQALRHRGHLGRWRALARHLGRRRERFEASRSANGRGPRDGRSAIGDRGVRAGVRRR